MFATGTPHRHATGKVARDAAVYPFLLCKAILVGLCKQLREDGHLTAGACGFTTWNETLENLSEAHVNRETRHILSITADDDEEAGSEEETSCLATAHNHERPQERPVRDALTGQVLDRDLVAIARKKEMNYFLFKMCG